jgi:hypothetical protein
MSGTIESFNFKRYKLCSQDMGEVHHTFVNAIPSPKAYLSPEFTQGADEKGAVTCTLFSYFMSRPTVRNKIDKISPKLVCDP